MRKGNGNKFVYSEMNSRPISHLNIYRIKATRDLHVRLLSCSLQFVFAQFILNCSINVCLVQCHLILTFLPPDIAITY